METENLLQSARIMIVDDDVNLCQILFSQLKNVGVQNLAEAKTAAEVFQKIEDFQPDILILDVQLPDGSGFDICKKLRDQGFEKPILMLTAKDAEANIIKGLETGANDYIAKPMRFGELLARIRSQLRQFRTSDDVRFTAHFLDFIPANKTLAAPHNQRIITLTEKETLILKRLFRSWPDSVSRDNFLQEIWGYHNDITTHTLETHIYRLRQKIARLTDIQLIETASNGYRLNKETVD